MPMPGGCTLAPNAPAASRLRRPRPPFRSIPFRSCYIGVLAARHLNASLSTKRNFRVGSSIVPQGPLPPAPPLPSEPPSGHWRAWVAGTVVTILLSFFKSKWVPFLKLKDEIDVTVGVADRAAEVVEMVAEEVEKVAEVVADNTPEGSRVHAAAEMIEKVAKEVAKDAHIADAALDKAVEVEKEVERDVESLVEPLINYSSKKVKKDANP